MLSSKFDLYKLEWLELVFEKRNKNYGAYDLRHHYADNMLRAVAITVFSFSLLSIGGSYLLRHKVENVVKSDPGVVVKLQKIDPVLPPPPKTETAKQEHVQPPKPLEQVSTKKFVVMNPTEHPKTTEEPLKTIELTRPISSETTTGKPGGSNAIPETGSTTGTGTTVEDITVHDFADVAPEPEGGVAGWSKFLQKNLHYPVQATDAGASGRVFLTFVVEKDGSISNIVLQRRAGYGMDEEAVRVLKMAPKWKPGLQHGQPVRVQYTIPINFTLATE